MRQDRLTRLFGAAAPALVLLGTLALVGCNKPASPEAKSGDSTGPSAQSTVPDGSTPGAPDAAPQPGESTGIETGDEGAPELPDMVDGTPAMMSEEAFLLAYRDVEGVVILDDGLMYRVLTSGKGKSPRATDKVRVIYKGTLMDGSVFDQTAPGQTSEINLATAIAGWREALPLMKEGDKWEVVIPSSLAYGEAGKGTIGPNSPLVFEIQLVEVVGA